VKQLAKVGKDMVVREKREHIVGGKEECHNESELLGNRRCLDLLFLPLPNILYC
jgi:hypothetical protein